MPKLHERNTPRVPKRTKVPPEARAAWETILRLYPEIEGVVMLRPNVRGVTEIRRYIGEWAHVNKSAADPAGSLAEVVAFYASWIREHDQKGT